jgi:hypothetical protein
MNKKKILKEVKKEVRRDLKQPIKAAKKRNGNNGNRRITKTGKFLRQAGGAIGNVFGNRSLGENAGGLVSRIFGQGAYKMGGGNLSSMPPSFAPLGQAFRVAHREYLSDIFSTTGFGSTTYYINPGLRDTFPWLSSVAANFEQYCLKGFVVYLKTNSATAVSSTNTALGVWGAVTQYEVTDPDFTYKQECENYMGCSTCIPCESVLHMVECKRSSNVMGNLYVRSGEIPDDIKFYDHAKFQLFTQGMQEAGVNLGELWISYDVEFSKPRLPNTSASPFSDSYSLTTNVNYLQPLGTELILGDGDIKTHIDDPNAIQFPANAPVGLYLVSLTWQGTTTATVVHPTYIPGGSLTIHRYFLSTSGSDATKLIAPSNFTAGVNSMTSLIVLSKSDNTTGFLQVGSDGVIPTGTNRLSIVITLIDVNSEPPTNSLRSLRLTKFQVRSLRKLLCKDQAQEEEKFESIV